MTDERVSDVDLAELVELARESAKAFIGGDMARYLTVIKHADDYTLMSPTGGPTVRGFINSAERLREMKSFFKSGVADFELVQLYASGDLAVLVGVERQHGEVGDYPSQEWSLRLTLVFRREGGEWRLAHRHADALVHAITFDHLAELARGEASPTDSDSPR